MHNLREQSYRRVLVFCATRGRDTAYYLPCNVALIKEVLFIKRLFLDDQAVLISLKAIKLVSLIAHCAKLSLCIVEECQPAIVFNTGEQVAQASILKTNLTTTILRCQNLSGSVIGKAMGIAVRLNQLKEITNKVVGILLVPSIRVLNTLRPP